MGTGGGYGVVAIGFGEVHMQPTMSRLSLLHDMKHIVTFSIVAHTKAT